MPRKYLSIKVLALAQRLSPPIAIGTPVPSENEANG
jgi:hypothetical protein